MSNDNNKLKPVSIFFTTKAVLWSFLGIRNKDEAQADMSRLNLKYVIVIAIFLAILFVVSLVLLVNFVTR